MHRLAVLGILIAGCHASTTATPTKTVANRAPVVTYQLLPFTTLGPEGRHSAQHSTTDVGGSLAIEGTSATVTIDRAYHVSYVHCPVDAKFSRQACAPRTAEPYTKKSSLVLTGTATTAGDVTTVQVAKDKDKLTLECRQAMLGLACTLGVDTTIFTDPISHRTLRGPFTFVSSTLQKDYTLAPVELAAWQAPKTDTLTGKLRLEGLKATFVYVLDGKPVTLTGRMKQVFDGLWIGVGWIPERPLSPLLTLTCNEVDGKLSCESAADYTVFDKFHRPDKLAFEAI